MPSKLAIHVSEISLISNKSVSFANQHPKSTIMPSSSTKVSALTPLSPGAEEFRKLLGLRVHPNNGRFYCGAPTAASTTESTKSTTQPPAEESSSIVSTSACPVLLSLEDSLMWRETLEIWHKSRNLLDSAIYKWAAAMLCDNHYGDEKTEVLLWERIKSRFSGSKYVAKGQQDGGGMVAVWPEMKATEEAMKTLQRRVAAAEAKVAEMASEKTKACNSLAAKEMELEAMKRLRKATEQGVAQREGTLTELKCRNDEMKSHGDTLAKKIEEHERSSMKKEEAMKELIARNEELKTDRKELKQKLEDANRDLAETKGSLKELRSTCEKLNERYEDLVIDMKDSQDTITRQESWLKYAETMSNEFREEVKKLRQFKEDTRGRLAEQDGALTELRRENKELREQNASISDQLATARHIIGGHEKELGRSKSEAARSSINGDDVQRKDLEGHNAELVNRNKGLFHQVQDLKNLRQEMEEENRKFDADAYEREVTQLRQERDAMSVQINDLKSKLKKHHDEQADWAIRRAELAKQLRDTEGQVEFEKSLNASTSEKAKKDLDDSHAKSANILSQLTDLQAKHEATTKELEQSQSQQAQLKDKNSNLSGEIETLQRRLEDQTSRYDAVAKELDEWQAENEELSAANQELSEKLSNIKNETDASNTENAKALEHAKAGLQEAQAKTKNLENEKKRMFRQLEILKSERDEEKARHQADLSARHRASQRREQSVEPSIQEEEEMSVSSSKRRSHIWRKLSRRNLS